MICRAEYCNKKTATIVGDCNYCKKSFCLFHRLPEKHHCEKQQLCNQTASNKLINKLNHEAIKSNILLGQ